MRHKLCLLAFLVIPLYACDIELQETPQEMPGEVVASDSSPSLQEASDIVKALTEGGTWKLSSRSENGAVVPLGCHLDDQIIFEASKITLDVGAIRCTLPRDSEQQIENDSVGRWQMTDRRSILISLASEAPYEAKIIDISAQRLTLEYQLDSYTVIEETYFAVTEASEGGEPVASDGFGTDPIIID